jgi:hypothetical protein
MWHAVQFIVVISIIGNKEFLAGKQDLLPTFRVGDRAKW